MNLAAAAMPPTSAGFFAEWRRREPVFFAAALAHAALIPLALGLMAVDGRTYLDLDIWVKPLKFLVSLTVWFGFLAWAAGWLPRGATASRWWRPFTLVMVVNAALEMIWIGGAAAAGVGSHFNSSSPLWAFGFTMAAFSAVILLGSALVYGAALARGGAPGMDPVFRLSAALGFLASVPLTLVAAFTLGGNGGHFVGGPATDANGLWLMGWARGGGDLRVAHFFALHAMHALPLIGWIAARTLPAGAARLLVLAAAGGWIWLTGFTYFQALAGRPFLPFL